MVNNEPIKLQNNVYLYSGDVITINDSSPLLVEVITDQTIKLRNIKNDKYLSKTKKPFSKSLNFSTDFENAPIFTVKKDNDKISLQTDDKRLKANDKGFYLSSKERWLTISKRHDIEDIANFEEIIIEDSIKSHKEKEEKGKEEELLITDRFYDNKSNSDSKHNFSFTESRQKEHSFTRSKDFTFGVSANLKLTFSSIAGLNIGGKFETKIGNSNTIKIVDNEAILENSEVTCPPWKKMRVELRAKKNKSTVPYTAEVKRKISERIYEYLIDGKYSCDNYYSFYCSPKEITVRNILLVGWTGSGKSTLANVLSDSKVFVESNKSTSETKWGKKSEEFEWRENYYCVIDNIGFGDTEVNEKQELIRIGKAINEAYQGISHVLFVYKKRFSDKEKEAFGKLAALKITNSLITVVRSNFDNFESKKECEKDGESLKNESSEIREVLNNCRGLLHVNNDDKDSRDASREIVLNHLHDSCERSPFKPEEWKEWKNISVLIENYFAERRELENKKDQADTIQKEEEIKQQIDNLETNTAEQVREEIQRSEIFRLAQIIQEAK